MSASIGAGVAWIVLIVRVPSEPSRHRVAVWRELRRVGAVQLGQGCWALPDAPPFAGFVDRIVALVSEHEGESFVLVAAAADDATARRIRGLYDAARRAEWAEFASECAKCLAELDKEIRTEKFTLAELDEEEQNVDRLRRWHRELRARDLFDSIDPDEIQRHLDACAASLEQFTALVYTAVGLD
jgi:DNA-binding transcriptional regulator PaaX